MSIKLNDKIKLTTESEKAFVGISESTPDQTFSQSRLSEALVDSIQILAERKSPILEKIYRQYEIAGKVPPLDKMNQTSKEIVSYYMVQERIKFAGLRLRQALRSSHRLFQNTNALRFEKASPKSG